MSYTKLIDATTIDKVFHPEKYPDIQNGWDAYNKIHNSDTSPEDLRTLFSQEKAFIRRGVVQHKNCPEDVWKAGLTDPDETVRYHSRRQKSKHMIDSYQAEVARLMDRIQK